MYKYICVYCGKEFEHSSSNRKYCSRDCKNKATSKKIECTCDNCNKIIYKKKDEYEKNEHHFCSKKCHHEFKSMGKEEIICLNCGKKKVVNKKDHRNFCSYSCAMEYRSKEHFYTINSDNSRKRICKNCNKEFIVFPSEKDKTLCSSECRVEWLKNNVYNNEFYKQQLLSKWKESFNKKYNNIQTNVEILEEYVNAKTKIHCKCKIHKDSYFDMTPSHIIKGQTGCKICSSQKSINEEIIDSFLKQGKYSFERQYVFNDCKYINPLPFDFFLLDFNVAIEYDGEHHYKPIPRGDMTMEDAIEELKLIKIRDAIKTTYCEKNNIPLIRIPYWEKDNLLYYLWDELVKYNVIIER